jgi:hypothetical protein
MVPRLLAKTMVLKVLWEKTMVLKVLWEKTMVLKVLWEKTMVLKVLWVRTTTLLIRWGKEKGRAKETTHQTHRRPLPSGRITAPRILARKEKETEKEKAKDKTLHHQMRLRLLLLHRHKIPHRLPDPHHHHPMLHLLQINHRLQALLKSLKARLHHLQQMGPLLLVRRRRHHLLLLLLLLLPRPQHLPFSVQLQIPKLHLSQSLNHSEGKEKVPHSPRRPCPLAP